MVLLLLLAFVFSDCLRQHAIRQQKILTVNNIRGISLLNILSGKKNLVMPFYGRVPDEKLLHYFFYNWWVERGVEDAAEITTAEPFRYNAVLSVQDSIIGKNVFLNFSGVTFIVCTDDMFNRVESIRKLKTDYLIITKEVRPDVKKLLKHFETSAIIIDSSVGQYESAQWTELCGENQINCWPVREKGAFVMKVK